MKVSFNTFEEYCKKCEFHEYESISHKHYCYKNKILNKSMPWKKRIKVNLTSNSDKKEKKCKWQEKKKDNGRTYEVCICDKDTCDNNKYSVSIKSNLDAENKIKIKHFAKGLQLAFPDFQYNENELTKEFIEGFLKGKMISKCQSSNSVNNYNCILIDREGDVNSEENS